LLGGRRKIDDTLFFEPDNNTHLSRIILGSFTRK
jgi:hypothetical protein